MTETSLKKQISNAMKDAMRARDKQRLGAIRLIMAEIKRIEVDERIDVADDRLLAILDKMVKQRRDSISQYESAGRSELATIEADEITVIETFLPTPLNEQEIATLISEAIENSGAESIRDMGKVMAILKPRLQGRADIGKVSQQVKASLS